MYSLLTRYCLCDYWAAQQEPAAGRGRSWLGKRVLGHRVSGNPKHTRYFTGRNSDWSSLDLKTDGRIRQRETCSFPDWSSLLEIVKAAAPRMSFGSRVFRIQKTVAAVPFPASRVALQTLCSQFRCFNKTVPLLLIFPIPCPHGTNLCPYGHDSGLHTETLTLTLSPQSL